MNKILEIAEKYLGYKESPAGSNKTIFGEWANYNGVPWCGLFVSKCYEEAGCPLSKIGFSFNGFAGCQTAVAYFTRKNKITNDPQPGDIVFFDWQQDGKYDHTGIFSHWLDDEWFYAIEGNTSVGNDSNGGSVMLRQRNVSKAIFVHP